MRYLALLAVGLMACGNEYHPEYHPQTQYEYSQTISQPVTVFNSNSQQAPVQTNAPMPTTNNGRDPSRILVLQGKHLDRPAQVIGTVDAHEAMGSQDAALWTLKKKAAELGADAVVGVDFNHGEGPGEPTHLSGIAVRFLQTVPYPVD
jgi:hypothetical protein